MAQNYKILSQVTPPANSPNVTNVYVTDASTSAVVGTITVSGLFASSNSSFSLLVRAVDEAESNNHFIFRGSPIPADDVMVISGAITMGPNTVLAANSYEGNISFTAFGVELT